MEPKPPDHPISPRRRIDIPTLSEEKGAFKERIVGQDEAVDAFAILLTKLKSGIRPHRPGPLDAKFLAGPSGVGKTEMVYALAELLSEGQNDPRGKVIKINGGEYQEQHNIARLFGSPPGYIGSEDPRYPGGTPAIFSQQNLDQHKILYTDRDGQTRSVVLILVDEAEKANIALHRAFSSVLDHGKMDLANNTSSDFSDAVIFYTSNVGNEQVEQKSRQREDTNAIETDVPEAFREVLEESIFSGEDKEIIKGAFIKAFPPEFQGRIKDVIVYNHLNREAVEKIARMRVKEVEEEFAKNGIRIALELLPDALAWLTKNGYNRTEGARALAKLVEREIYDKLILAHTSLGVHRKKISADMEEDGSGIALYFNEGEQLPEFTPEQQPVKQQPSSAGPTSATKAVEAARGTRPTSKQEQQVVRSKQAQATQKPQTPEIPQIPQRFKRELLGELVKSGIVYYVSKRNELARKGLLDPVAANIQPEIRLEAAKRALTKIVHDGVVYYTSELKQIVDAGILTAEAVNNWEPVKKAAKKRLLDKLKDGVDSFIDERNQLVKAGIGTVEEWNKLLNEPS